MEYLGTTQLASYCGTKKSCLFPDLAPTSTTKDTYQSYYLPGYHYLSSWGPSLLYKVALVPPSSDKQFNPIGLPPTVVPSLCSALHARYSTRDWHHTNMVQLKSSEDSREWAGRLNADSMRLMQDKDQLTYQMQKDSRRNLGERISTTDFWRSELIYELECLLKETQELETTKKRLDCAADEMKEPLKADTSRNLQTEDTVMLLERSIKAKEYPLKVAQTRLEERTKRPNIELCRDAPQLQLVTEVYTIGDTLQILKRHLQEAHDTLQMLNLYKSKLEYEISVKANSFFIDKKCMDMRKVFPSTPQLIGYT